MDEQTLRAWAAELGFSACSLCSAEPFLRAQQIVREQAPLIERRQLRFDPAADDPRTTSIAVLLWPYLPAASVQDETLFIDSYYQASNAAYHAAKELEAHMLDAGCFAKANVSYPAKDAALRAGLGLIGRHSMLITPKHGTRVVIILMATDLETGSDKTRQSDACLQCGRCAAACPSGAITHQGMEYPERCLRNFMMEGVIVPEHLRSRIGMRLIGCDICQRVCPMQPQTASAENDSFYLSDFVTSDAAAFSTANARLANQIGRNAARPQRVRAQAALLAGNSGNPAYLPVLRSWAALPFEAVSAHARWAVDQIERRASGLDHIDKTV